MSSLCCYPSICLSVRLSVGLCTCICSVAYSFLVSLGFFMASSSICMVGSPFLNFPLCFLLYIRLSVGFSDWVIVCLFVCLSVYLSLYPSVYLQVCMFICLSALLVYLCFCFSFFLHVHPLTFAGSILNFRNDDDVRYQLIWTAPSALTLNLCQV